MNILTYDFIKKQLIIIVVLLVLYLAYNLISIYKLQKNNVELFENYERNIITISKEALNPLNVCVGYENGNYDLLMRNISNTYPLIINNHEGSSIDNVKKLIKGECELCICQLDAAVAATKGTYPFNKPNNDLRFVCNLYPEVATLIVNKTSGITKWQDLRGKRITIGGEGFSSYYNFFTLLTAAGVRTDEISILNQPILQNDKQLN